uniref:SET domain-containing protein n=1 Tax=Meloidogyne javanica TaxID=6303 RepID=A0A915NA15_MELJA
MKEDTSSLESGESPSSNEEGCSLNNSITSFLHRLRHMPEQKKQQLVSNSVAIVRNTGTPKSIGNCASVECSQRESVPLTADEVFEVVYGVREVDKSLQKNGNERAVPKIENDRSTQKVENERSVQRNENERAPFKMEKLERTEKTGMVFVVDAHERRQSRLILLEDLPDEELPRFGSIFADDIESSDRFVHCDICDQYFDFCCLEHPLYQCQDRDPAVSAQNSPSKEGDDRASLTLPGFLYIHNSPIPNAGKGVFAKVDIPVGIVFGPYEGILLQDPKKSSQDGYSWELRVGNGKPSFYIDAKDPRYSNWMRYINSPRHESEQNLLAFQYRGSVFYRVYRPVDKNSELLVWYGKSFGKELGIINATSKKKPFVFYPGKNPFVL